MKREDEFVEIFTTPSPIEADYLRLFLSDSGIACLVRDLRITPYPVHVKNMSDQRLSVAAKNADRARALIRQAGTDQEITLSGQFIGEDQG
ncbi:MAG: hypothetical protein GWP10_11885 [Nitrospiraceae bacterium]|nr:hypothetical protein [Nitrospiraceae bacterium]